MAIKKITDQLGNEVHFHFPPRRIISLVPSQTELLFDLGLEEEVIGITKFCVHPHVWHKSKTKVGGTKTFDFDKIDQLKPDLIIGNKEENYLEGIGLLQSKYPVWMSDIKNLEEALTMIGSIGDIVGRTGQAESIKEKIFSGFPNLIKHPPQKTLYLIWRKPWMAAGQETFIDSMLKAIGLQNCIEESRYPELTEDLIQKLNPEVVLLSSEPFPFAEKHEEEIKSLLPNAKVMLVNGEFFSWYGSRLALAPEYFNSLSL